MRTGPSICRLRTPRRAGVKEAQVRRNGREPSGRGPQAQAGTHPHQQNQSKASSATAMSHLRENPTLPRTFLSSLKVRRDVFLPLSFAGGNLHVLLPGVPVASSVHIRIQNLSRVQIFFFFCRRDLFHCLDQTGKPKVERVIFKSSPRAKWKKIDQMT